MATNTAAISAGTGLVSGINYQQLISQLTAVEQQPIVQMQQQQQDYQLQIAALSTLSMNLSTFKSALDSLNSASQFNTMSASVTNTSSGNTLLSVSASNSAAVGSHSISVNQIAQSGTMASQGWADTNTTAIAPSGGTFAFKIGSGGAVTTIGVTNTMTLQGLADAINSSGSAVTASIINDGSGVNPNRLLLKSNSTGYANQIYITTNSTGLDYTNKNVGTAYAYTSNSYTGTVASNAGTNYTGSTNKSYLMQVVTGGASGTATYKYSIDGGITWLGHGGVAYSSTAGAGTNGAAITTSTSLANIDELAAGSTSEGVQASFSATGTNMAAGDRFSIAVYNPAMQAAQDAVLNVDGATITKSSNTITDVITGVTMNLLKADTSAVTLTVSSSSSTAQTNIQSFVSAYNTLRKYMNQQTTYNQSLSTSTDINLTNPLLYDTGLFLINQKINSTVMGTVPGTTNTKYSGLSQIGISADSQTGILTLDTGKLSSVLQANPSAVASLFTSSATPSNSAVSFKSMTSSTQPGNYSVYLGTAPKQASVSGDEVLSSNGLSNQENVTFKYTTNHTATNPTYTTFNATLAAGSTINTIVNTLNSTFATQNVGLTASNVNGKVSITSAAYGADSWFQASSDQVGTSSPGGYQLWDTNTVTTPQASAGVDIVGTINGHSATGVGNVLTASAGFPESGLAISVISSQAGGFGNVAISSGVASSLSSAIASYTDSTKGIIATESNSRQTTINSLTTQENTIASRITQDTQSMQTQFAALESILAKYKSQSDTVTSMFATIGNGWVQNSGGTL